MSKNNLGDNIQLVLELEGDNISWIVRDPNALTKDTLEFAVVHNVYDSVGNADSVGVTRVHYQKKRILIDVDPATGKKTTGDRSGKLSDGTNTIAAYVQVKEYVSMESGKKYNVTCIPTVNKTTKQLGIWTKDHITEAE